MTHQTSDPSDLSGVRQVLTHLTSDLSDPFDSPDQLTSDWADPSDSNDPSDLYDLSDQYDPCETAKTSNPIPSGSSDLFDPSSPSTSYIHMCMSYQQSLPLVPVSEWSG